ncbi:phosphonate metabolism transcriptional regulator PhnF [Aliidongia dinghuensis]|uniref:Phosphonate metabolism transcriptional regulator PhnF n=1 Tax=Aliidongia dinghuensis TaxID=1867774 RepID=A0A8J3E4B7_9PROT|nr:phosphonate metabolism transcriptional regulator PhnF [Aliidongia dinghuensis]GGF25932.1 phosphonate metabolism transcriptional regulator PhnF [Aliidongia dinghuensis]
MVEAVGEAGTVERGQGVSLWRQIDRRLSAEIAGGAWAPGERLPTEQALSQRFQVNRHTIRRAIQAMVQRGLLRVEQGRGTFVQEGVIDYMIGRRTRFTENIARNRREAARVLLTSGEVLPPPAVAKLLKVPARQPVLMLETLSSAGGMPISLSTSYYPAARFPDLAALVAETGSITQALQRCGLADYARASTRVTARMATAEEARRLKQPVTRPVLLTEAVDVDTDGRPVSVAFTRFASDRVQLVLDSTSDAS